MSDLWKLRVGDLELGFADLFENRAAALGSSTSGALYGPMLEKVYGELRALPPGLSDELPRKMELAKLDLEHDGLGAAIWYLTEAYLRSPLSSAELRADAQAIREAFVPARGQLNDRYEDEAARAGERRPKLDELAGALEKFPVAGGQSLADWAAAFLDRGEQIGTLLEERTSDRAADRPNDRSEAFFARTRAVGLLTRFRAALRDEIRADPALPRDLEARVFDHLDALADRRDAV